MVTVWFDTGHRRQFMTVQEAVQFCDEEVEANVVEITDDAWPPMRRLLGGAARCMRLSVDTLRKAWAARLLNWGLLPVFHEKPAARSDGPNAHAKTTQHGACSKPAFANRCYLPMRSIGGSSWLQPGAVPAGDDAEDPRTDTLRDRLDDPALASAVTPFENDTDLQALVHDPLLQFDQFDMQLGQLLLVCLVLQLAVGAATLSSCSAFLAFFAALIVTSRSVRSDSGSNASRLSFGHAKNKPTSPGMPPG